LPSHWWPARSPQPCYQESRCQFYTSWLKANPRKREILVLGWPRFT